MYNYHQIKAWHDTREKSSDGSSIHAKDTEDSFSRHYVKTKLENGLLRVWRVSVGLSYGVIYVLSMSIEWEVYMYDVQNENNNCQN